MAEIGSVLAFNIWKIAGGVILNLENEDYQVDTYGQRMDIIEELTIFLAHMCDRLTISLIDLQQRTELIQAVGKHLAETVQDNREDTDGAGDYRTPFIDRLNSMTIRYGACSTDGRAPGFSMCRILGERLSEQMGPRHSQWVPNQTIDIEVPGAMTSLLRVVDNLFEERDPASVAS